MGLYFRRSLTFGPLRVNFSTRGVGYSVGAGGFRTGVRANGRRYTRVSLPGTGLGYEQTHGRAGAGGCLLYAVLLGGAVAAPWWMA